MAAPPAEPAEPAEQGFLILHGWQNHRPTGHWQHWLAGRLADLGHLVDYPRLPDPDHPDPEAWTHELRTRLGALRAGRRTVVCHSLACALWLRAVAGGAVAEPVDRVLLVAPPSPGFLRRQPDVAAFVPPAVSAAQLSAAAGSTRLVCGDDDPCCPEGAMEVYGRRLGIPVDVISGAAHLTPDSGYGAWPALLDWCLDPAADTALADAPPVGAPPTHAPPTHAPPTHAPPVGASASPVPSRPGVHGFVRP
ncbi:RBBP9/YdeN family alpha/beta hydrolase [Kitasatospora sp. NPDC127111]|uniref:RBBP9/YdeN family alpha/beta hydrolase n=1 Tax=Kitasatospora sp. NPDC127111 TaxID=3345363 RepID=UPI0036434F3E